MALEFLIQEYISPDKTAGAGTNTTTIKINSHGLSNGDLIINATRNMPGSPASRIVTVVDTNTLTVDEITGQTSGDSIKLFKYIDRTSLIKVRSLKISSTIDRSDSASMEVVSTGTFIPKPGQNVIIRNNSQLVFGGTIKNIKLKTQTKNDGSNTKLFISIQCEGFNHIPARRTITANETNTTAGDVVERMIENYLHQEGITKGTINSGAWVEKYPQGQTGVPFTVRKVLDDMAEMSGYKWYIDGNKALNFIQEDSITNAPYDLTDNGAFKDYSKVELEETLANYRNKQFVRGGTDAHGNTITVSGENSGEISIRQESEGGSGVYGHIIEDSNITFSVTREAESGTSATVVNIINHGLADGDMVMNMSRGFAKRTVTVINQNSFSVSSISGQSAGDQIVWYPDANAVIKNNLKRYGSTIPKSISFETGTLSFKPGMKLYVSLAMFGSDAQGYYLIESVDIFHLSEDTLRANIKATKRDETNFSTQSTEGWVSYFNQLTNAKDKSSSKKSGTRVEAGYVAYSGDSDALLNFNYNENFLEEPVVTASLVFTPTNIALSKDTDASSSQSPYTSDKAVDGQYTDSNSWLSQNQSFHWLLVDFEGTYTVGKAIIQNGNQDGTDPVSNMLLQYWTGSTWEDVPGSSVSGNTNTTLELAFNSLITTTKMRIFAATSGVIRIREFEIFTANDENVGITVNHRKVGSNYAGVQLHVKRANSNSKTFRISVMAVG